MDATYQDTTTHIDDDLFEEMRELLNEEFDDLIKDYIQCSYKCIERLADAFADNNNREGFEIAHKIKGASASLGFSKLTILCSIMQDTCRRNEIHEAAELVSLIQQEIITTNIEIENRLN